MTFKTMRPLCLAAFCLIPLQSSFAVPISRVQVAPKRGVVIATVDLERVFAAYPATKKAREELGRLILIKENEIASKRAEIFSLTEEISRMKSAPAPAQPPAAAQEPPANQPLPETLPGMPASTHTMVAAPQETPPPAPVSEPAPAPASPPPSGAIAEKEAELEKKKQELKLLERAAEKNLEELEQAKTKTILAHIYVTLRALAQEKNVDLIVDKNAILWGAPKLDLTDSLLQELRNKAIESE